MSKHYSYNGLPNNGNGDRIRGGDNPLASGYADQLIFGYDPEVAQIMNSMSSDQRVRVRPGYIYENFILYRGKTKIEHGDKIETIKKRKIRAGDVDPSTGKIYAHNPNRKTTAEPEGELEWTMPFFNGEGEMWLFEPEPKGFKQGFPPGTAIGDKTGIYWVVDTNNMGAGSSFVPAEPGHYIGKGVPGERTGKYANEVKASMNDPSKNTGITSTPGASGTTTAVLLSGDKESGWLGVMPSQDKLYRVKSKKPTKLDENGNEIADPDFLVLKNEKGKEVLAYSDKAQKWDLETGEGRMLGQGRKPIQPENFARHIMDTENKRFPSELTIFCNNAKLEFNKEQKKWAPPQSGSKYVFISPAGFMYYENDSHNATTTQADYGAGNPPLHVTWANGRMRENIDAEILLQHGSGFYKDGKEEKIGELEVYQNYKDPGLLGRREINKNPKKAPPDDPKTLYRHPFTIAVMSLFRGKLDDKHFADGDRTAVQVVNLFQLGDAINMGLLDASREKAKIAGKIFGKSAGVGVVAGTALGMGLAYSAAVVATGGLAIPIIAGIAMGLAATTGTMFHGYQNTKEKAYRDLLPRAIKQRRTDINNDFKKNYDMLGWTEFKEWIGHEWGSFCQRMFIRVIGGVDGEQKFQEKSFKFLLGTIAIGAAIAASAALFPPLAIPLIAGGAGLAVTGGAATWQSGRIIQKIAKTGGARLLDCTNYIARAPITERSDIDVTNIGSRLNTDANQLSETFEKHMPNILQEYGVKRNKRVEQMIKKALDPDNVSANPEDNYRGRKDGIVPGDDKSPTHWQDQVTELREITARGRKKLEELEAREQQIGMAV